MPSTVRPGARIGRTARSVALAACLPLALVACAGSATSAGSGSAGASAPPSASTSASGRQVRLVVLGDSDASGKGDPTGQGWAGRYAALVEKGTGRTVKVDNQAQDGLTSDELRSKLAAAPALRQALQGAEIVVIGIGGADLNQGDDALAAGRCTGRACYEPGLRRFGRNMDDIAATVRTLSPSAVVRAISLPNAYPGGASEFPPHYTADLALYQVETEREMVCSAVRTHGGACADVVRAFNGPKGTGDAYAARLMTKDPCCYPSGEGQQRMAELVYALGLEPMARGS